MKGVGLTLPPNVPPTAFSSMALSTNSSAKQSKITVQPLALKIKIWNFYEEKQ